MKITTTKTTVQDLLALLADADPNEEVTYTRAAARTPATCWCGCRGTTQSRFVPGHDSRFHGLAKRVARGQAEYDVAVTGLPHDMAVAEFDQHVAKEQPLHLAREKAKATKRAEREAKKAARGAFKLAA